MQLRIKSQFINNCKELSTHHYLAKFQINAASLTEFGKYYFKSNNYFFPVKKKQFLVKNRKYFGFFV